MGKRWIWLTVGPGSGRLWAICEDRILNEGACFRRRHATSRSHWFGLSVNAATRYTKTVDHPELVEKAGSPST